MESRKMVLKNLFAGQQWKNRLMDRRRGEERVRCMERITYITICKIDDQCKFNA